MFHYLDTSIYITASPSDTESEHHRVTTRCQSLVSTLQHVLGGLTPFSRCMPTL